MSCWNATDYDFANEEILKMASQDNTDLSAGGVKYDTGKIRMDLLPPDAELAIASVFTYGAEKYDDWNWAKGMRKGRLIASTKRHLAAMQSGEVFDVESGRPHSWHVGCNSMMLIALELRGTLIDDDAGDMAHTGVQSALRGHEEGYHGMPYVDPDEAVATVMQSEAEPTGDVVDPDLTEDELAVINIAKAFVEEYRDLVIDPSTGEQIFSSCGTPDALVYAGQLMEGSHVVLLNDTPLYRRGMLFVIKHIGESAGQISELDPAYAPADDGVGFVTVCVGALNGSAAGDDIDGAEKAGDECIWNSTSTSPSVFGVVTNPPE